MPRLIRVRYHTDNLPGGELSTRDWLQFLSRAELIDLHEWAEPWPLLWTLGDREAVEYARRYHPRGPAAFLRLAPGEEILLDKWRTGCSNPTPVG